MIVNTCASRTFAEEGHAIRITAERNDILLHPSHGLPLILQSKIPRTLQILRTQEAQRPESNAKKIYMLLRIGT